MRFHLKNAMTRNCLQAVLAEGIKLLKQIETTRRHAASTIEAVQQPQGNQNCLFIAIS